MVGLAIMGGAAVVSALGKRASGKRAQESTEEQAKAAKKSLNKYAKALEQKASKERGGMSMAQRNQMAASGSMQRASEVQRARDENKRGSGDANIALEQGLAEASQMGAAQQMQGIDALSQQQAQTTKARRDQLEMAGLQATQQAQAIDPEALGKQAAAGTAAAITADLAQPIMQAGAGLASPYLQAQGQKSGINVLTGAKPYADLDGPQSKEAIDALLYPKRYQAGTSNG